MGEEEKIEEEKANTKKCPFCANNIKKDAIKCEHCKEWMDGRPPAVRLNTRSMMQLWLMGVCSLGLYFYWWSYKNWEQIKNHKNLSLGAGKRTAGMIVPLLGYYFIWLQFHDINEAARQAQTKVYVSEGVQMVAMIASGAMSYFAFIEAPNNPVMFLVGLTFLCAEVLVMYSAQLTLNDFWKKEQAGLPEKNDWTMLQGLVIVLGGFYVLAMLIAGLGVLFGVPNH